MHKVYKNQYFVLFQCHLWHAMYVFCDNSKFISIQSIINAREKKLAYFLFLFLRCINYFNTRKQISLQIDKVAKHTYFTRGFGCRQFLTQLTKFQQTSNDIMWSSYDFMQCKRSPDTISVHIHNIHFNFTFKHDNKIVARKIILICKFNILLKLFFN